MSLDKQIKKQYAERLDKEYLYNSEYSKLSDLERQKKIKKLVAKFITLKNNTTILEIGAGQGGNIPLLLDMGFNQQTIFVNELLPERAAAIRLKYPQIKVYEGNALKTQMSEKYDIVFQSTVFTSVLNDNDRKELADKMWELLKPGGIILWYDFIYNNPSNPNVKKVSRKQAEGLFSNAIRKKTIKVTLAPPIGRRVGKLYNIFNIPVLRSHILGVFQK